MKGNKKILVIAILLLLISVTFSTYAIYRTSMSGTGTATAAGWDLKFKKGDTVLSNNFTFTGNDVTWTNNPSAVAGKIAPGATGYIEYTIDATGSEVDVIYSVAKGSGATEGIDVAIKDSTGATLTGDKTLAYAASNMSTTVRIYVTWEGATTDESTKDTSDLALETAGSISIPITMTARQSVENKTGTAGA